MTSFLLLLACLAFGFWFILLLPWLKKRYRYTDKVIRIPIPKTDKSIVVPVLLPEKPDSLLVMTELDDLECAKGERSLAPRAVGDLIPEDDLARSWVPLENPEASAKAVIELPDTQYAPWMKSIKDSLFPAVSGEDYKVVVSRISSREPNLHDRWYRIEYHASSERGVSMLNSMAGTFRMLSVEPKQLEDAAQKKLGLDKV